MKKIIIFFLIMVSIFCFSACSFFDENDSGSEEYSFEYSLNEDNNSYTITKYKPNNYFNEPQKVVIPATYNDKPVTEIGSKAFYARSMEELEIPEGIEIIGSYAFFACDELKTINFPKTLTIIKEYAFERCDSLKKIEISESVEIGFRAFYDCEKLEKLVLSENATIGGYSFAKCKNLTIVDIRGAVSIGESGFQDSGVITLTLSDKLELLGANSFNGCEKLEIIYVYEINGEFNPETGHWWSLNAGDFEWVYINE